MDDPAPKPKITTNRMVGDILLLQQRGQPIHPLFWSRSVSGWFFTICQQSVRGGCSTL